MTRSPFTRMPDLSGLTHRETVTTMTEPVPDPSPDLTAGPAGDPPGDPTMSTGRLLGQLRALIRQVPPGLRPEAVAEQVLAGLASCAPYDRAGVFVQSHGTTLVQLAARDGVGDPATPPWELDLGRDGPLGDAWFSQLPQVRDRQLPLRQAADRSGSALVLPLHVGGRSFGLVAAEIERPASYPAPAVRAAERVVAEHTARLNVAVLIADLAARATVRERRRLAREIHDGIAQELAALGYLIDGLVANLPIGGTFDEQVRTARATVSGLLREVRGSISDLRTTADEHGGLGAALSACARAAGRSAPFAVLLSIEESPGRLRADIEAELLRIGQEAIANARRHARAERLWLTCIVHPPAVLLRIEDDGIGPFHDRRPDSAGLDIMRERAETLGASLSVTEREPSGTCVEVQLGHVPTPFADALAR